MLTQREPRYAAIAYGNYMQLDIPTADGEVMRGIAFWVFHKVSQLLTLSGTLLVPCLTLLVCPVGVYILDVWKCSLFRRTIEV